MKPDQMTVLVVGATGKFAQLVVPALRERKATVRALVRDPRRSQVAQLAGADSIIIGDLRNPASLDRALVDVDSVFLIGPAFSADEAAMGVAMVEAAQRAQVKKFVFSSVIQPTNTRLKNHASKIPVEEALYASRLQYTILQPSNFMQNIGLAWPSMLAQGVFAEPFPNDARIARVDYRDVAELAAIALTEDRLAYATLELSAGMFSRQEIALLMTEALSRPIEAVELAFAEWATLARLPYSEDQLEMLAAVHSHYRQFGLGGNALVLRAALGREPRSLQQYIMELATGTSLVPAISAGGQ